MPSPAMLYDGGGSAPSATSTTPYIPPAPAPSTSTSTAASPSSTYDSAIPGADIYGQADATAIKAYNDALAGINNSRQSLLRANGYLGDIDPTTGQVTNVRVDPYNPYGGLQQMFDSQAQEDADSADQSQQRGLVGGLAHQGEAHLKFAHGVQRNTFGQQLQAALQSLASQQASAGSARDNALWQAQYDQAMAAIQAGAFNPANYGAASTPANTVDSTGSDFTPPPLSLVDAQGNTEKAPTSQSQLDKAIRRALAHAPLKAV